MQVPIENVQYHLGEEPVSILLVHPLLGRFYVTTTQTRLQNRAINNSAWGDTEVIAEAQLELDTMYPAHGYIASIPA